jgi:TonB family protein
MAPAPQAAAAPQSTATPMPRFSAETMLTIVNFVARDQGGNSLDGLKAGDFVLTEDGVPQRIMVFEYQQIDNPPQGYYVLGYYTPNDDLDGKFRRIKVTLNGNPAAKIDYRAGYFARREGTTVASVESDTPGPGVRFPQLRHKVEPAYSEEARMAKYSGTVPLLITVNADGSVGDVQVKRSLGLGLDEKAIEAVKQWSFLPGMKDLVAIPMQAEVVVTFRLF